MQLTILKEKIESFRRKYYLNLLVKGTLQFGLVVLLILAVVGILEHLFWFTREFRTIIFFGTLSVLTILLIQWVILPFLKYLDIIKPDFSHHDLARKIGHHFPEIEDKLINALQLETISVQDNSLIIASIDQYLSQLTPIPFNTAINIRVNLKYAKYIVFIMLSMLVASWIIPGVYKNSTKRIFNYHQHYSKPAPFQFTVLNKNLLAFRNEDFTIDVNISGLTIPDEVYAIIDDRKVSMNKRDEFNHSTTIRNILKSQKIYFEGGGFMSQSYEVTVVDRADLLDFDVRIVPPKHTQQEEFYLKNTGNIIAPEGSVVTWNMHTRSVENASILINDSVTIEAQKSDNQSFIASRSFVESSDYQIHLSNKYGASKELINYNVTTIKDEYPEISANFYLDTILYEYIIVTGIAKDDYGLSALSLHKVANGEEEFIPYKKSRMGTEESYYIQYTLDDSWKNNNSDLNFYVSVTDNDQINGRKTVRSATFKVHLPTSNQIDSNISKKSDETGQKLNQVNEKAESLNDRIKDLQERLLSKQNLEWQEEKMLDELLEQRKKLEEEIQQMQDQFKELNDAQNKFEDRSEQIQEKAKQLQQLMDEVLDEETKKLYEELQQLMENSAEIDDLKQKLDQLAPNEKNLENELERALELFKRLKVEAELEQASKKLDDLSEKQQKASDQNTSDSQESISDQSPSDEQQEINDAFEKIKDQIEKAQELNQQLKNPQPLQDMSEELDEIQKGLEKAKEQLDQNNRKSGGQQQKKNSQSLKSLSQKLSQMMESMQMEMLSEDIDNLRNILDNLVKLSFEQEEIIDGFYAVSQVDPRFVELSQRQLKLDDDAQILEDSLLALAERVVQISSFITREIGEVNYNIDAAMESLRNRDRNKALSNQQYAMASINNLALLLDDLLQQLQNSMASSMGQGKPKDEKEGSMPNLQQLQQQLSQQIQEMKESGMKGRQLSEQLSKMAAQQEMLREKLEEMKKAISGQDGEDEAGKAIDDAIKLMEENEVDLFNKRLTQQLIDRQEKILTRMLDAENAMQEQDFDDEREAVSPGMIYNNLPKAFEEYLEERRKETELLKTVPIDLNPFYKKEVNDYFRRISIDN